MFQLVREICFAVDQNQFVILILLDLSSEFDTVNFYFLVGQAVT